METLSRKVILESVYDSHRVSPKGGQFTDLAEVFICEFFGILKTDLADRAKLRNNIGNLKSRAASYMGGGGFPTFIEAGDKQVWLATSFPRPKVKDLAKPSSKPTGTGKKRGRPSLTYAQSRSTGKKKMRKQIADSNDLEAIIGGLNLKLKRAGYSNAAKVLRFIAHDLENNPKKVLDALKVEGMSLSLLSNTN